MLPRIKALGTGTKLNDRSSKFMPLSCEISKEMESKTIPANPTKSLGIGSVFGNENILDSPKLPEKNVLINRSPVLLRMLKPTSVAGIAKSIQSVVGEPAQPYP
jgi:hypothetical protein